MSHFFVVLFNLFFDRTFCRTNSYCVKYNNCKCSILTQLTINFSIGLTEAEVERMFSLHKSMLSQNVTNLGTETLHNRCLLYFRNENEDI